MKIQGKKLLILSASSGGGHTKVARALESRGRERGSEVVHIDILDLMGPLFRLIYGAAYVGLIRHLPWMYGWIYGVTDRRESSPGKSALNNARHAFQSLFWTGVRRRIGEVEPDAILFTHSLPVEHLASSLPVGPRPPSFGVVVTDYGVHGQWVHERIDRYFVSHSGARDHLIALGADPDTIHITGIPVSPSFFQPIDKTETLTRLGLSPERDTVILLSGAKGVGPIDSLAETLLKGLGNQAQVIALAGDARGLLRRLRKLERIYSGRLLSVGYVEDVSPYLAASDVAVGKSGGVMTTECLAMGLPLMNLRPIPGQEEWNMRFLEAEGLGVRAETLAELVEGVASFLGDPARRNRVGEKARAISRRDAAERILDEILGGRLTAPEAG